MSIPFLQSPVEFPDPNMADSMGIVAVGADLTVETLLKAYSKGIFPWFGEDDPVPIWWSPPERMVLFPGEEISSKSMKQLMRNSKFECSFDEAFEDVIRCCAEVYRPDQDGTWITEEMIQAYVKLHKAGYAHSLEVWSEGTLIGGLYGVSIGKLFCGESMFSLQPNASKIAFIKFSQWLKKEGFMLLDCQNHTPHLESLGAVMISRSEYLKRVEEAVEFPTRKGKWLFNI